MTEQFWHEDESPFSLMGQGPGARVVQRVLREEQEAEIREATQGIHITLDSPIGTDVEEVPPHYIGPLMRPYDSVMIVGKPGSGKSSAVADMVVGTYDLERPACFAGSWPIDASWQHGRTFILNGETTPRRDWAMMVHKAMIARGISPKSEIGDLICRDRIHWADPALLGWGLNIPDDKREARVLRLADELAQAECSTLVMDPVFAIFGASENSDNDWIFNSLTPLVKALKERKITSLLISHPSGVAENGKASLDQQFSPYGSKQQLALIDCHVGIKRDSKDRVCVYSRKTRRADWIPKNQPIKLLKGSPAGYAGVDDDTARLWLLESPEGVPLPPEIHRLMRELPAYREPFRKPDGITNKRMARAFNGWLSPFGLLEREELAHEIGKPYQYTWTPRGLKERTKL